MNIKSLTAKEIAQMQEDDTVVLIDVREPREFAAERIPGAMLFPLSRFDPNSIPAEERRKIVLHCAMGGRSAKAVALCQRAGRSDIESHLHGGIGAWKAAGLPTVKGS